MVGRLTEAKEAIVDALLGLALNRCTAQDATGRRSMECDHPRDLLAAFSCRGSTRPALRMRPAIFGLRLWGSTSSSRPKARATLSFVQKLRSMCELPTWDEIVDPRHEMMPQVQLSRQTRQEVERRARDYIAVAIGALPQFEDDEPDERPGDATAEAEQAERLPTQLKTRRRSGAAWMLKRAVLRAQQRKRRSERKLSLRAGATYRHGARRHGASVYRRLPQSDVRHSTGHLLNSVFV